MQALHTRVIQDEYTNSIPDKDEIWGIMKGMRNDASLGPDGLNTAFYKATWKWMGDDITRLIQNFYYNGHLPQQLNETSITLIPKKCILLSLGILDPSVFVVSSIRSLPNPLLIE
jgi:hypothetical protein